MHLGGECRGVMDPQRGREMEKLSQRTLTLNSGKRDLRVVRITEMKQENQILPEVNLLYLILDPFFVLLLLK